MFSTTGNLVSYATNDGRVQFWDTTNNTLKQEYIPESHLASLCSCVQWMPVNSLSKGDDIAAIGTADGSIYVYSVTQADAIGYLKGGHATTVTALCWRKESRILFSACQDGYVVEWNILDGSIVHKWRADKYGVYSLCLLNDNLLTGSSKIRLWSKSYKLLKVFSGHASNVEHLEVIPSSEGENQHFFLSVAVNDNYLHVWCDSSESTAKCGNSICSFSVSESISHVSNILGPDSNKEYLLATVSESGERTFIFQHDFTKAQPKPREFSQVLRIVDERKEAKPLAMNSCSFEMKNDNPVLKLMYGSHLKPVFDTWMFNAQKKDICLLRKDVSSMNLQQDNAKSKSRTPVVAEVNVLTPTQIRPVGSTVQESKITSKELSLGELIAEKEPTKESIPQSAGTLTSLLSQALASKDKTMLNGVLLHRDDNMIMRTVEMLPVSKLSPLLTEIISSMQGHAQSGILMARWIRSIIIIHGSFISSNPELLSMMEELSQIAHARSSLLGRLSTLHGKLDFILSQIDRFRGNNIEEKNDFVNQPALLTFDDSMDEHEDEDLGLLRLADKPNNENLWDEKEEMDLSSFSEEDVREKKSKKRRKPISSDEGLDVSDVIVNGQCEDLKKVQITKRKLRSRSKSRSTD